MKKWFVVLFVSLLYLINMPVTFAEQVYQLTPNVHHITYKGDTFDNYQKGVKLLFKGNIDDVTKNKVKSLLSSRQIPYEEVTQIDENVKMIIVRAITPEDDPNTLFDKYDAYTITISKNSIDVLGKDTDAAFYGLQTLEQIFSQAAGKPIRSLMIQDYADVKYRGFIEGYYGIPWSHENRKSLMQFGGQFKANTYIFAPKDDVYHSSKWKELYPESELAKVRELVKVGQETKTRFVWTIHPFMSQARFDFNQYEVNYNALIAKFEQLYAQGVRQFGILADDVGNINREHLLRLLKDVSAWAIQKGDVEDILFCPAGYNHAWQGNYAELKKLNEAPKNVQFFWTGDTVVNKITQEAVNRFRNGIAIPGNSSREPYFWLNWPVNDYKKSRLLMGPAYVLQPNVQHLAGVVTNPMQQAQASKVGIFATVNYAWNTKNFNADENWQQSFKYIDSAAADSLKEIAKHLQDVSPSGHNLRLDESVDLAPKLQRFLTALQQKESLETISKELLEAYANLYQATQTYLQKGTNTGLKEEMRPWIQQLAAISKASESLIQTAIALEKGQKDKVWEYYANAISNIELSKTYTVQNINSVDKVEAGAKHLTPFMNTLNEKLSPKVSEIVLPNKVDMKLPPKKDIIKSNHFNQLYQGNLNNLTDGDTNTHAWFSIAGNSVPKDAYIGLDLGSVYKIGKVSFLQGTANNADIFADAVLEYSVDGVTYKPFRSEVFNEKDVVYDASSSNISARYVRLRNGKDTQKWAAFRELSVGVIDETSYVHTNVPSLNKTQTAKKENVYQLTSSSSVTLQPNEYIGIDLKRIRSLKNINISSSNQVDVMTGDNKDFLTKKTGELPKTARYIIVKNNSNEPKTINNLTMSVETNDILPMRVVDTNYTDMENPLAAFDGNTETQAWLKNSQIAGKYIVYDLGQTITLNHISQIVSDSEHDYIRHGKISVSENGVDYTDVLTLGDSSRDLDISGVYPDRNVQLLSRSANVHNVPTRYVKVEITKTKSGEDKWVRFNEIVLNRQKELPRSNNPTFTVTPAVPNADSPEFADDGQLHTAFRGSKEGGSLIYRLSDTAYHNELTVLQSQQLSHAKVSIQHHNGEWETIGHLDASLKTFDLRLYKDVVSVKIEWTRGNKAPVIYEMYTKAGVNRVALQEAINKANAIVESDYALGVPELKEKLKQAEKILKANSTTQAEIDEMTKQLTDALQALVPYKQWEDNGVRVKTALSTALQQATLKVDKLNNMPLLSKENEGYRLSFVDSTGKNITVSQDMEVTLPVKNKVMKLARAVNGKLVDVSYTYNETDKTIVAKTQELGEFVVFYEESNKKDDEETTTTTTSTSATEETTSSNVKSTQSVEITSTRTNKKQKKHLPSTSTQNNTIISSIGIGLICLGTVLYRYKHKKEY